MKYNIDKVNTSIIDLEYNSLNQMKHKIQHKKSVSIKINNDSIKSKIY